MPGCCLSYRQGQSEFFTSCELTLGFKAGMLSEPLARPLEA